MRSTRMRFIGVALLVCLFAIGMATFLNYFKYKATVGATVKSRVLVVANAIDNSVQASLALGLSFTDLENLPSLLARQQSSDSLIAGIDVFDTSGKQLYSTDTKRIGQAVPSHWTAAVMEAEKKSNWQVEEADQLVTGIALKNNFDLTVGYLALRYSRAYVDAAAGRVGKKLLLDALPVLAIFALLAPLALMMVIRRFERDMRAVSEALEKDTAPNTPFAASIGQLKSTLHEAEGILASAENKLATLS